MRPIFFLLSLPIALTACGSAPLETSCVLGESRACACTSGASGAQVCGADRNHFEPCVCDTLDAGSDVDGETFDAGAELSDAALFIPGECTLVPHDGCGVGQACRLGVADGGEAFTECRADATGRRGDLCTTDLTCARGYGCTQEGVFSYCAQYCRTGDDSLCTYWCQPHPTILGLGTCSTGPRP